MHTADFSLDAELLNYPKIDVHTHIQMKNGRLDKEQLDIMLEDSQLLGIEKLCVSIPYRGVGSECKGPELFSASNDIVMETVDRYAGQVFGYAFLHCGYADWAEREMERCLAVNGMIGIKLYHQYLVNDPVVVSVIASAAERDAWILLHQGKVMDSATRESQPLISDGVHIAELARQVPTARILCGHIPGGGDWEWTTKALKDSPSVYVDTSGSVIDDGMIEFVAEEIGIERMLFATDMSIEEGVGKILGADISREAKKAIFSDNFSHHLEKAVQ
jgi:hypothetical protein